MTTSTLQDCHLRVVSDIATLSAQGWDMCANPEGAVYNPFLSHKFMHALAASASTTPDTGWLAQHLILEDPSTGTLYGALPLYLKNHSQGEYVFDHGWADAYHRAGGQYYPKLVSCVPFTPATGRRILLAPTATPEHEAALLGGASALVDKLNVSSLHINFLPESEWQKLGARGYLQRCDQQFHWQNDNYKNFDDFLTALSSRKRKNLKKERTRALENNIEIEWLTGDTLTEAHWDAFFQFYIDTGNRKWGYPYLTRDFFSRIGAVMPEDVLLIMAKRDGHYIAGALNFIGGDTLFGRNWGCLEDHPFLHFEICYYQAIDFAIARGLKRVEAGAQGAHKLARGYLPHATYSAHYIAHDGLRNAIANYLESERQYVDNDIQQLQSHTPFRKDTL